MADIIVYKEEDSVVTLEDIKRIFGDKKVIIDNAKKIGKFIFEEYYRNINNGLDIDFEEFLYNYEMDNRDFKFLKTLRPKAQRQIEENEIEYFTIDNGTVKVKLKNENRKFCLYGDMLDYYIKRYKQNYYFGESAKNLYIDFVNNLK